jgi:hypothetical protein
MRADCRNLKHAKGQALNVTLSDASEEEKETLGKDMKFLAFIASHNDHEESKSYYSESNDEEELKEAYKTLFVKFVKLRERHQKNVLELNMLKTKKSTLLRKIKDLDDELVEAQLMLDKFIDNKLAQMLSEQKCLSNKTSLGFVATTSDVSNIVSSSKTLFVKPKVDKPQNACMDKGKGIVGDETKAHTEPVKKPPNKRSQPICHHCGINGHI